VFGIAGVLICRKSIILMIMSLEVMLLSVNFNLVFFSTYLDDVIGNLFILFILAVGASESAIGLSLVIAYYKSYE
jgi:NADH-quinone oxidoreductase subunit K